eukprot:5541559-Pyramimonas_sp.AAC.1
MELVERNLQGPIRRAFLAAGHFNAKSGPTRSYVDPVHEDFVPGAAPGARSRGSQPLQSYWG